MKRIPAIGVLAICAVTLAYRAITTVEAAKKVKPAVTFNKDVAPIFFKSCAECHRAGEAVPFSILTYKDARPWAKSIKEKVIKREMPPWHADPHYGEFKDERRLSQAEINTITAWVDGGAIEGEAKHLPPAPKFTEGWNIGQPDLILSMPQPYEVAASGPDEYQYFEVPTGFTEDKFVEAIEVRPGNRQVVHHVVVRVLLPAIANNAPALSKEERAKRAEQQEQNSILYSDGVLRRVKKDAPVHNDGCALPNGGMGLTRDTSFVNTVAATYYLAEWAPGRSADVWEAGMAKRIPAGAKIQFQVHYSKTAGSVQTDRSSIGLIFAKKPPTKVLRTTSVYNGYMQIPPGAERFRVAACWTAPTDITLAGIWPHMHVRGAGAHVEAMLPDGRKETLLSVPRYEFAWQISYKLKQPKALPKGTRLMVTAWFDNSAKNKFNPDPTQTVRWGDPTYDEMIACFIDYTEDATTMHRK